MRKQKAVYWAQLPGNDPEGQKVFAAPIDPGLVRWEQMVTEIVLADGTRGASTDRVFVGMDMQPGDALMEGPLQAGMTNNPSDYPSSAIIQAWSKIPTLSARQFVRYASL